MNYESLGQLVAQLRQQGFFVYTNYCQKIDEMKLQAQYVFNDYITNLGQLYINLNYCLQKNESLKQESDPSLIQSISDEEISQISSQSIQHLKRNRKELLKHRKRIQRNLNNKKLRNALTNLGSQLLTYIYLKKKNLSAIKSKFPQISTEQVNNYYEWARKIKQSMNGYINIEKLKEVWQQKAQRQEQDLYLEIFRTLSSHYINCLMVPAILTSKKIANNGKILHLAARRKLIEAFRSSNSL